MVFHMFLGSKPPNFHGFFAAVSSPGFHTNPASSSLLSLAWEIRNYWMKVMA